MDTMITLVGDSPTNPPFTGPIGGIARSWLKQSGINPLLDVQYVVLSDVCAGNVDWLRSKWVLALGQRSLDALCPIRSLTIGLAHGHFWSTKSGMAMATYAPNKHSPELNKAAALDVEMFGLCVRGDVAPAPGHLCVRCKKEPVEVVVVGMPLGHKCKKFARAKVEQPALFEMRVRDET